MNEPPVAADDIMTVPQGATVSVLDSGETSVLANDTDPNNGDHLTVNTTPVVGPSRGTLTLNADGSFVYTHNGGFSPADSFIYEVCDSRDPQECDTATVFINITIPEITVTVSKTGDGDGVIASSPLGINCGDTCSASFSSADRIRLNVTPAPGSLFEGWLGDDDCGDGELIPNGDKNCIAVFGLAPPPPTDTFSVTVTEPSSRVRRESIAAIPARRISWNSPGFP